VSRGRRSTAGDDNLAMGEVHHQFAKLRPVGSRAGDLLAEYLFAAGRFQLGNLVGEVLDVGRDAGIAVS
jgi:hypothetical protein